MATLVRWDPYREMMSMRRRMDQLFDDTFRSMEGRQSDGNGSNGRGSNSLELDVSEREDQYLIRASLPGVDPEDIDISVHDNMLTISGETQSESESDNDQYHIRERRYGHFSRSIGLPNNVNADDIDADSKNGVLTITLPKKEETKPRRISVKGGNSRQTIEANSSANDKQKSQKNKEKSSKS